MAQKNNSEIIISVGSDRPNFVEFMSTWFKAEFDKITDNIFINNISKVENLFSSVIRNSFYSKESPEGISWQELSKNTKKKKGSILVTTGVFRNAAIRSVQLELTENKETQKKYALSKMGTLIFAVRFPSDNDMNKWWFAHNFGSNVNVQIPKRPFIPQISKAKGDNFNQKLRAIFSNKTVSEIQPSRLKRKKITPSPNRLGNISLQEI